MKEYLNSLNYHFLPTNEERKNKLVLNLNENSYNCSKRISKNFKNILFSEYPDDNCTELCNKIAKRVNVNNNQVLIGNGSGEILQIISRAYIEKGDEVITCVPTYPYYEVETIIEGGKFIGVPLKKDKFDIDAIIDRITTKTKIIYITNPNNPTGTIITTEEQERLIKQVRSDILIVIDEAYYEYVTDDNYPDSINHIAKHDNVCVLRTFSKAYGLAALRIGYLVGSSKIIDNLNKVRLTFNVSAISQIAAIIALDDQEFIKSVREKNNNVKEYIYKELEKKNIKYIKSETNFVLIKINQTTKQNLIDNNIMVKHCTGNYKEYIRLTVGTKAEIKKIISLL